MLSNKLSGPNNWYFLMHTIFVDLIYKQGILILSI